MPAIAFDGTNFLVVYSRSVSGSGRDLFAKIVSPAGSPIGSEIALAAAANDQMQPTVAFDGANYLVAWVDERDVNPNTSGMGDIWGALVTPAGQISGAAFAISQALGQDTSPAVASDGSEFLVVWGDGSSPVGGNGPAARGRRLAPNGAKLETTPFVLGPFPTPQTSPSPSLFANVYDGNNFFVAWFYAVHVRHDGTVVESSPTRLGSGYSTPTIAAFNGSSYLALAAGTLKHLDLSSSALPLQSPPGAYRIGAQLHADTAYGGGGYFAAWIDARLTGTPLGGRVVFGTRVSSTGDAVDTAPLQFGQAAPDDNSWDNVVK